MWNTVKLTSLAKHFAVSTHPKVIWPNPNETCAPSQYSCLPDSILKFQPAPLARVSMPAVPVFDWAKCIASFKCEMRMQDDSASLNVKIRRPRPWPRQGRRLGPPQVWNFSFLAFQGRLPALKSHRLNIPLACFILQPTGTPRPRTSMASYGLPSLPFASP